MCDMIDLGGDITYKFFTRKWFEYLYDEKNEYMPKSYYLRHMDKESAIKYFDNVINKNDEYDLEEIIKNKFDKYLDKKKEYINSYNDLEERFGNYEIIDELMSYEEEFCKYKKKLDIFVKENKYKIETIIKKLRDKRINIDVSLNEEYLSLLGVNVLVSELRDTYMIIRKIYKDNIEKYDDLTEEELQEIDHIRYDVDCFLTCYSDYLSNRKDKFDKKIDDIYFHDALIVKFEDKGNNIILEIKEDFSSNLIRRLTFHNVKINYEIIDDSDFELSDINSCIGDNYLEISGADYGNYEDYNYYLKIWVHYISHNINEKEKVVFFIADKIDIEDVIPYPLLLKYNRSNKDYVNNLSNYKDIIEDNVYKFFSEGIIDMYYSNYFKYFNNNIEISFESFMKSYKEFSIKFVSVFVESDMGVFNNFIENLGNKKITPSYLRFIDYVDNKFIIGMLISNEQEIIFKCSDILINIDGSFLDNSWVDLNKFWDSVYENSE